MRDSKDHQSLRAAYLEDSNEILDQLNSISQQKLRIESNTYTQPSTKPRRSTFSLTLPWKPNSTYSNNRHDPHSPITPSPTSNTFSSTSKSQRNFISTFPELSHLICTPTELCPSCLATPPHTPPEILSSSFRSTTPSSSSNTLCDTLSSEHVNSTTGSSCLGQLSEYVCALDQGDLRRGMLYVTNSHLCFNGGRSKIIISYEDIVSVERLEDMFSTSISIHVRYNHPTSVYSSSRLSQMASEVTSSRNNYIFTNFVNCNQVQAEIEKLWFANDGYGNSQSRRVNRNQSTSTTLTFNRSGLLSQDGARMRRRLTRAQSMVEGNSQDHLGLINKLESYIRPLVPRTSSAEDIDTEEDSLFNIMYPINESNRPISRLNDIFENQQGERSAVHLNDTAKNTELSFPQGLAAPIPIQISSRPSSVRGYKIKSPTPPPSLLSPSLTTTKLSRSSSTVHGTSGQGINPGMVVHVRKESEGSKFESTPKLSQSNQVYNNDPPLSISRSSSPGQSNTISGLFESERVQEFSMPIACGCDHYKNAVLSTIVPMPLETCFEILFSAQNAGQGDTLTCEANRVVNGSSDVGVTVWESKQPDASKTSDEWVNKERRLEYTVLIKVPMLAKTSALCFETQQVLEHNSNVIRIHSEQRTPNVPFGEQFTCVSQLCLTRESLGNTRIKCHSEIKFKKSIILSGKIEAASLEVASSFYRELVRQLVEVSESRDTPVIVRKATATSIQNNTDTPYFTPTIILETPFGSKIDDTSVESLGVTASSRTLSSRGTSSVSAAQSLLSQQYLKNPPTLSRHRKDSTFSTSSSSPPNDTIDTPSKLRKAAKTKHSAKDSINSSQPTLAIGEDEEKSTKSANISSAADIWSGFMKKSMALFNKSSSSSHSKESTDSSKKDSECSVEGSESISSTSTLVDGKPEVMNESSAVTKAEVSTEESLDIITKTSSKTSTSSLGNLDQQQGSVSKVILWAFAFGLLISILNAWRLVNTVSSVAQIMQSKNEMESKFSAHSQHSSYTNLMATRQLKQQAYLVPLKIQTEMLRAEIMELMELLETQKKLRETYIEPEIQNVI